MFFFFTCGFLKLRTGALDSPTFHVGSSDSLILFPQCCYPSNCIYDLVTGELDYAPYADNLDLYDTGMWLDRVGQTMWVIQVIEGHKEIFATQNLVGEERQWGTRLVHESKYHRVRLEKFEEAFRKRCMIYMITWDKIIGKFGF